MDVAAGDILESDRRHRSPRSVMSQRAEELVQAVFLKVWRSSSTVDSSRGSFSTWLYRVTRSCALDLYRKRASRVRQVPDGAPHIAAARDSSAGPQEVVDESWLSWRVS